MATGGGGGTPPPIKGLYIDPEVGYYLESGGKTEHMVVNTGETKLALKVRCSNNTVYRVMPVYVMVEAGQCQNLVVTRRPGPARADKLLIQMFPCKPEDRDAREVIKREEQAGRKPETARILLCVVNAEDYANLGVDPSRDAVEGE